MRAIEKKEKEKKQRYSVHVPYVITSQAAREK